MKKILMIGMTESVGGIETYIMNVFRHLDRDEYQIYFPSLPQLAYKEEIVQMGGKLIEGLPRSRRNPFQYYSAWKSVFRENQFDAIYFNNCDIVSLDVLKIAKKAGVPVRVFHAHNSSNTQKLKIYHRLAEKYNRSIVGKVATDLLACSPNAGRFIFGKYPFIEVKNGIEIDQFRFDKNKREKKREELCITNEKIVLYVGRFTDVKNPLFAIEVCEKLHAIDNNVQAYICGDGKLMEAVQEHIVHENSESYIHVLGNRGDIDELYQAADILIMPSLFEGFPFVLVEAQCSGLKCVCSDRVAQNTNLSGTVEYYPLEIGTTQWSKLISEIHVNEERNKFEKIVRDAGYDINETVSIIERIVKKENSV